MQIPEIKKVRKARSLYNPVIGIDPSLTSTGFVGLSFDKKIIDQECFRPKTKGTQRLSDGYDWIMEKMRQLNPCLAVIEGYSYHSKGRVLQLGEFGGVVRMALFRYNIPYIDVAPLTLKKFVLGSGRGDKNLMLLKIFRKWKVEFNDDNIADAYGLARLGHIIQLLKSGNREWSDLTKKDQEVVKAAIKGEPNAGGLRAKSFSVK